MIFNILVASGTISAGAFSSSSYSAFSYDALGNRRSVDNNGVAVPYGVSSPSSSSVSSSSSDISSSSEMAPAANSANQFDFAGENALTWNDRGDLTQFGDKSYSWDRMGRLTSATDNATSIVLVRYEYDPLGRKTKRLSPTEIIYFIYDGWQVIEEYTQATASDPVNLSKYHVYGQYIDELIATGIMNEATETIHYFHAGLNHNVEAITDASGSLVSYYTYDAFGSATEHPTGDASGNTTLFQGREWDDQAGLYYFRNRWYSAELGRFISRDPIDFQAGDVNLYRFVGNGPVNGVDPWGLKECCVEKGLKANLVQSYNTIYAGIDFEVEAIFRTNNSENGCKNTCDMSCCAFNQYVRGSAIYGSTNITNSTNVKFNVDSYVDDGYNLSMGLRPTSSVSDLQKFKITDSPGFWLEIQMYINLNFDFKGVITDKCNGNVLSQINYGYSAIGNPGNIQLHTWGF